MSWNHINEKLGALTRPHKRLTKEAEYEKKDKLLSNYKVVKY